MKLVTFDTNGARHIGAMLPDGNTIADFTAASPAPHFRDMLSLIDGGAAALDEARALVASPKASAALAAVKLLAPVPEPRQMRDFLCFEMHLRQARANRYLFGGGERGDPAKMDIPKIWYEQPIYYKCNRFSVIGTGADVIWPLDSKMLDYELEFGIILGKGGKNIPKEQARAHIFGYLIFNDVSARDIQIREMQGQLGPTKGKDFDTGNILGPWLVTADEMEPYRDPDGFLALEMSVSVNGIQIGNDLLSNMGWPFEELVAYAARGAQVRAGDVLGSGTCGNGGCLAELWGRRGGLDPEPLKPGDVVEMTVQGIGTIRNTVVAGVDLPPVRPARSRSRARSAAASV